MNANVNSPTHRTLKHVSVSTQNQALNALLFLYREVPNKKIGLVEAVVRAKRPQRMAVVLSKEEVTGFSPLPAISPTGLPASSVGSTRTSYLTKSFVGRDK